MRKRFLSLALALVLCAGLIVPAAAAETEAIGYTVIIEPAYEEANYFSGPDGQELAAVKKDGKWGYIDTSGNVVIDFQYDFAGYFSEDYGKAIVAKYGEPEPVYDSSYNSETKQWEYTLTGYNEIYEFGWIDMQGNLTWFYECMYQYDEEQGSYWYTTRKFYKLAETVDSEDIHAYVFTHGVAYLNGKCFREDGERFYTYESDFEGYDPIGLWAAFVPTDGYLYAHRDYTTGLDVAKINADGTINTSWRSLGFDVQGWFDYDNYTYTPGLAVYDDTYIGDIYPVNDGVLAVGEYRVNSTAKTYDYVYGFMRVNESKITEDTYGFLDICDWVIQPRYSTFYIRDVYGDYSIFNNGVASVANLSGKWGAIDKQGGTVIPFNYDRLRVFINKTAVYELNGKFGLINDDGLVLTEAVYENITDMFNDSYCVAYTGDKHVILDIFGNEHDVEGLVHTGTFEMSMDGNYVQVTENGLYGFAELNIDEADLPEHLPYTDVKTTAWYYMAVRYMRDYGIMTGTSDTTFSPMSTLDRKSVATVIYRLEDEPDTNYGGNFTDVPDGKYYSNAISWAYSKSIVTGYSDSVFGANDDITREQLATMIYRYAGIMGYDVSASSDLSGYTDASSVSSWAADAMKWAVAEGLITGMTDTTLVPSGTATRAQCATILQRFMEQIAAKAE